MITSVNKRPDWRPRSILAVIFAVCLLTLFPAQAQPAFLTNGLVAYYPFNGNAIDESGSGNHLNQNPKFSSDRFNTANSAALFDGTYSLKSPNVYIPGSGFSASIWVYLTKPVSGNGQRILLHGSLNPAWSDPDRASFGVSIWEGGVTGVNLLNEDLQGAYVSLPRGSVKTEAWQHIAVTSELSQTSFYLDGVLVGVTKSKVITKNQPIVIGGESNGMFNSGYLDDVRIYNMALSAEQLKDLYYYELKTRTPIVKKPRAAVAVGQIVNGFLVGISIIDGGNGYTNNPSVSIEGGGGFGAKAYSKQVNGVVTQIDVSETGSGYETSPIITVEPPPFPPSKAIGVSEIVNGFVIGVRLLDGGHGYRSPPAVIVSGGGGSGATAVATVSNGVLTGITVVNPGTGYTSAPIVRIASPPFSPELSIDVSRVNVNIKVVLGRKYQIESSKDMATWTATGPAFIAEDENLVQEFQVESSGRYFRINQVP